MSEYMCGNCCKVHDCEDQATLCCAPDPIARPKSGIEEAGFLCGWCEEFHETREDARLCCAPEAEEALFCQECERRHWSEVRRDMCCEASIRCPRCSRLMPYESLDGFAIRLAGHCSLCNPLFTSEQRDAIEIGFELVDGRGCSLVDGRIDDRDHAHILSYR